MQSIKTTLATVLCTFFSLNAFAGEKLVFSIDLVGQGDRTPVGDANNFKLSEKDISQEMKLGKELRKQYVGQYQLLPDVYHPHTVFVRSTDAKGVVIGTDALMLGLYPEQKRMPKNAVIPIYSISAKHDNLSSKNAKDKLGYEFLDAVTNYFGLAIEQKVPLKYVLFSGHDSALMSVMTALGSPLKKMSLPSRLNFSLFKNENDYVVKIRYNNKPINVPVCKGEICTIKQFIALAQTH